MASVNIEVRLGGLGGSGGFGGRSLQTLAFREGVLRIGRMKENDLVINNAAVSRFHATLAWEGDHLVLEDRDSENGCYVNGHRIERAELSPGDEVIVGKHHLVLEWNPGEPAEAPAAPAQPADAAERPASDAWDASATYCVALDEQEKLLDRLRHGSHEQAAAPDANAGPAGPVESEDAEHAGNAPLAVLVVKLHGQVEKVVNWEAPLLYVGRAPECDIVADHPMVSRRHAMLVRSGDEFEVHDMKTRNGTLLNGFRVRRCTLQSGDVITLGESQITFRREGDAASARDSRGDLAAERTLAPIEELEAPPPTGGEGAETDADPPRPDTLRGSPFESESFAFEEDLPEEEMLDAVDADPQPAGESAPTPEAEDAPAADVPVAFDFETSDELPLAEPAPDEQDAPAEAPRDPRESFAFYLDPAASQIAPGAPETPAVRAASGEDLVTFEIRVRRADLSDELRALLEALSDAERKLPVELAVKLED